MRVYSGDNPSKMYLDALGELLLFGNEVEPRGKRVKEIRPVCFEFTNPRNRAIFVEGRDVNPFFQLAEAMWILSGGSDVASISKFNSNIAQFSDDGKTFNAPYGERLRFWNKNDYRGFVFSPLDQLYDVYTKISKDLDTRQAVAVIFNPFFDNSEYTTNGGKDIPCNMILSFKVRDNKLDLSLFNRSNDIHWGLFGANLVQFSTIQEAMANWLGLDVGTYYHITDSLHVYLEDYSSQVTEKISSGKYLDSNSIPVIEMCSDLESFDRDIQRYWRAFENFKGDTLMQSAEAESFTMIFHEALQNIETSPITIEDPYIRHTMELLVVYRLYKLKLYDKAIELLNFVELSQWKVLCSRFLYDRLLKVEKGSEINRLVESLEIADDVKAFIRGEKLVG